MAEPSPLQQRIQHELVQRDYTDADDDVMSEYIAVMLHNNRPKESITEELTDLIGDAYDPTFTDLLFSLQAGGKPPASQQQPAPVAPAPAPAPAPASAPAPAPAPVPAPTTRQQAPLPPKPAFPPSAPRAQRQQQQQQQALPPRPAAPVSLLSRIGQPVAEPAPPAPAPPVPAHEQLPSQPATTELCRFGVGCELAPCGFSHPSPAATADALVLSTDPCPAMLACADADCSLSHVSPAQRPGGGKGKAGVECRFGRDCARRATGECAFAHRRPDGSLEEGSGSTGAGSAAAAAVWGETTGKACRFGVRCTRADCKFAHPHGRPPHALGGLRSSPYARPPVSRKFAPAPAPAGGNRSAVFNVHAKPFVPMEKGHVSTRFGALAAAEGGEKILPSAATAAAAAPAPAPAPAPAAQVLAPPAVAESVAPEGVMLEEG